MAEKTWINDDHGNRASVEKWGSEEKARESLKTLRRCSGCSDCSFCSFCSFCSDCSYCSYCSYCSFCSDCSYCSDCSDCSDCSVCSYCSDCSYCSGSIRKRGQKAGKEMPPVPVIENIHQAVYNAALVEDAFDMQTWHSACGTTHCRAGTVVHLAGEAGRELEKATSCAFAAMQIYKASDPDNPVPPTRFFGTNEDALVDMKRLAEMEAAKVEASDG